MSIEWKEPPRAAGRTSWRPGVVAELRAAPGRWALVQEGVSASHISAWKRLGCEAVARKSPTVPGKADIYARWPE